ncbi:hypothetical protein N752_14265 [Desulforamulus aquiferis]|nr:2-oxoacid:acceptor oxidoreductase family protein [Desulforamulus aquiferis]RYD04534.1 hypothetical protein N752_14265 [Desulforamulus aquiferis]
MGSKIKWLWRSRTYFGRNYLSRGRHYRRSKCSANPILRSAARGGASKAEVIISGQGIDYPKVEKPDLFLGLNQESVLKYIGDCKDTCLAVVDSGLVKHIPNTRTRVFPLPITESARKQIGRELVANVVALGALQPSPAW